MASVTDFTGFGHLYVADNATFYQYAGGITYANGENAIQFNLDAGDALTNSTVIIQGTVLSEDGTGMFFPAFCDNNEVSASSALSEPGRATR